MTQIALGTILKKNQTTIKKNEKMKKKINIKIFKILIIISPKKQFKFFGKKRKKSRIIFSNPST